MHAHSHDTVPADLTTAEGLRAAQWGSVGLFITGAVEITVFAIGNSAGVLADAMHNLGDVSTTLALWLAFSLSRRRPDARYPYGYHRAEDLAGLFVLVVMVATTVAAGYSSLRHLITGEHPVHLALSAAAAFVGFAGNELVALYKQRVGRRIDSVALVADAAHSRVDGLVSLAALAGVVGVALGFRRADGLAGVLITVVIAVTVVATARGVFGRALDSVDPALTERIRAVAGAVPLVTHVEDVRGRWAGRALFVSLSISLPAEVPLVEAHRVAEEVRHALFHQVEHLREVDVHMNPDQDFAHALTAHHAGGTASDMHGHGDHDDHGDLDDHHDHGDHDGGREHVHDDGHGVRDDHEHGGHGGHPHDYDAGGAGETAHEHTHD